MNRNLGRVFGLPHCGKVPFCGDGCRICLRYLGMALMSRKPRLTEPLIRENGELRPATWDEALTKVATGFAAVKEAKGGEGFAIFSCSKSTNEMNYAAQKFGRTVLGTNNIDSCNRT